ncbi:hypothetical protein WG922_21590 [Ramlibacter sp. AN1015]|uniref:phage adaptor protein n=1 Tax=Ramlibacter sp. AN1015 TaxID=3133428 RepID=UPI0030C230CC
MPTILLPAGGSVPMTDFASLSSGVSLWLHRSDLADVIPSFISLAEERMNRALRVRAMEVTLSETEIASGSITAPSDTVGVKSLWIVGYERSPLKSQSFDFIKMRGTEGVPGYFAWQGDRFHFDGSGTVTGVLYEKIPSISSANSTNWLLTSHPSAYLHGALVQACIYLRDEPGIAFHEAAFADALSDIANTDMRDRYGSGPLQVRAR